MVIQEEEECVSGGSNVRVFMVDPSLAVKKIGEAGKGLPFF